MKMNGAALRIDAHHHLWRYDPQDFAWIDPDSAIAADFGATDFTAVLDRAGIDAAIVVQARQCDAETRVLVAEAQSSRRIVAVVGWIDLRAPDIADRLAVEAAPPLVGYRHVVQDEPDPDFLLARPFVEGVRAVAKRGLAYDILVDHAQLTTVPAFLDRVGAGRFVLDHAAKPSIGIGGWQPWADRLAAVSANPNVFCKVSGLITEADHERWQPADIERYLMHVFECFGTHRILWGSDWPVCLLAGPYRSTVDLVADFVHRHCPAAAAGVFGGNAVCAYALDGAFA